MKKKFALFDVDKTLIAGDSMFDLMFWTWKKHPSSIIPSIFNVGIGIIKYIFTGLKDIRPLKNGIFYVVKYLKEEEIAQFAKEVLYDKRLYADALNELKHHRENGSFILLVSASPEIYLKHFSKLIPSDHTIGTLIDEKGRIINENCKSFEKVCRINNWLKETDLEIDYESSVGYSDSFSADEPMLKLAKTRYLINSDKRIEGYKNLEWK